MLKRLFSAIMAAGRDATDERWWSGRYEIAGGPASAGIVVTTQTALEIPAVVDALNAITQPIAHLPLKVFRRVGTEKEAAPDHPAALLLNMPSAIGLTPYEWRAQAQWDLALHGNAYAEWVFGPDGAQGWRLHDPRYVTVETRAGVPTYQVTDSRTNIYRPIEPDLMWHLRTAPLDEDRVCGLSPVVMHRETIAHALAVQRYGARYFANDGQTGGIIKMPQPFRSDEDRERFLAAWRRARTGSSQHRDALLEFGASYERHQINNDHAQFLETRREMAVEIARIWHVPPHKIRSLERATFSNIEQQSLDFVSDTLLPWFALWETSINKNVIGPMSEAAGLDANEYFAEFNAAGLLRGDLLSRYQAYAVARQWGWISVNEIRALENMRRIDGGDAYLEPMNMNEVGADQPATEVQ